MAAFSERNFGSDALNNRIMGTRFDIEVCRYFHPERYQRAFRDEGIALTRALGMDSVTAMRAILAHVRSCAPGPADARLVAELSSAMRHTEAAISDATRELAARIARVLGRGRPLTELGDRVATSLQQPGWS